MKQAVATGCCPQCVRHVSDLSKFPAATINKRIVYLVWYAYKVQSPRKRYTTSRSHRFSGDGRDNTLFRSCWHFCLCTNRGLPSYFTSRLAGDVLVWGICHGDRSYQYLISCTSTLKLKRYWVMKTIIQETKPIIKMENCSGLKLGNYSEHISELCQVLLYVSLVTCNLSHGRVIGDQTGSFTRFVFLVRWVVRHSAGLKAKPVKDSMNYFIGSSAN